MTIPRSYRQWSGSILMHVWQMYQVIDRITITDIWTWFFSFTSFACSSIRDRTTAKSPRLAPSHTYPCMSINMTTRVSVSYRIRHDVFDDLWLGERWSDQFQTICNQANKPLNRLIILNGRLSIQWKLQESCNAINQNAPTSQKRQSKHATQ
mgnify:CR=1 FL=1